MNKNILFVDDEYDVISAYNRNLRRIYNVKTATSGREALEIINESGDIAAIVSDYRMPEMDGVKLLSAVKKAYPDTSRILITGHADLQMAIEAVNKGNIYRFLTKPCPIDDLKNVLDDALEIFRLKKSEHELLNKTLKGVINILVEIQAQIQPCAVRQIGRLRQYGKRVAEIMKIPNNWEFDIALMLSKVGCIIVPQDILEKRAEGIDLATGERKLFETYPEFGASLISKIPRLENIAEAIKCQTYNFDGSNSPDKKIKGEKIPTVSRILKLIDDYGMYLSQNYSTDQALEKLKESTGKYDPKILAALYLAVKGAKIDKTVISIKFRDLRIGMTIVNDIKDTKGNTLVKRGTEITDMILMKLIQASKVRQIVEPLSVVENSDRQS